MDLSNLRPAIGSTKNRKRIGRGPGSGNGKTAGKGHKGQNARSGGGVKPGFEGGQMPLQRRLPKRGFKSLNKKVYALVNLRDLQDIFEAGSVVDIEALGQNGLVSRIYDGIKILGDGDLDKALTVKAHKFSQSAIAKIEAAGGKAEVI
ncbi:ribosomal protein L15 [Syntrophotalea carbinolica DSM 2380]|uniref:Large ribosomal subunit protein uL15 n=1 Tax=Syntrophotalea carbinolica (strain DSM 2380 / NBRC 103641 / GraBd1) TaxID=338963 RepID=RL15_SYNC1|nr:50S ribosomal protein L15 [Syntrophotalea carbinolica]Q3A6M8.1 RecName: Full=Large ribosomal subunit protein uL15; AltName: Full=50S ribosomal protein L15 [Syntrophotalea carbinolica DSM 2380]ABA87979.1 ribosomal protein L15 [Syntrophotalea carbinolica DSM 2380]